LKQLVLLFPQFEKFSIYLGSFISAILWQYFLFQIVLHFCGNVPAIDAAGAAILARLDDLTN
jgi:hypothetical protein